MDPDQFKELLATLERINALLTKMEVNSIAIRESLESP